MQADSVKKGLFQFLEFSPSSVLMLDRELSCLLASRRWCEDFGFNLNEISGKSLYALFPETSEKWKKLHQRCLQGEILKSDEELIQWFDGRSYWIRWEIRPWYESDGVVGGLLMFREDISERKKVQDDLRESAERFRQLANSMPQIVWTALPNGEIDFLNDRWHEFKGVGENPESSNEEQDLRHPDDIVRCEESWAESIASKKPYQAELRLLDRKSETYRWFLVRAVPVLNAGGEVERWFGTSTDIHEQKTVSKRLSDVTFALDQSSILAITDAKGVIVSVNDNFCAISKYTREELIGSTHKLISSGRHSDSFFKDLWETISSGRIWRGEIQNRAKDGTYYWVDTVIVPNLDESGRPYQYTAIRTDITKKKQDELERNLLQAREQAALEASRLKSEFLANMSHEIRTPLNSVIGMIDVLDESGLSSEQREHISVIRASSVALLSIINDILDFSKIESGKLQLENLPFDLTEIVVDVNKSLAELARSKNLRLLVEGLGDIPSLVTGDPTRVRQILLNLVSNGLKFTNAGSVTVRTILEIETEQSLCIRFEVEDTGIGLGTEDAEKLFDPFVQSDNSTTRRYGGTGLGLSISKRLLDSMGGQIGALNRPFGGAVFWFRLTFPKSSKAEARTDTSETKASILFRPETRILLVEDIVANQRLMTLLLASLGLTADIANDGLEALRFLDAKQYDLVLLDCHMPRMDGYTLTKKIRARNEDKYRCLPIIAMTASAMIGDKEKCLAVGMSDYLPKPIRKNDLSQCLGRWLEPDESSINWEMVKQLVGFDEGNEASLLDEILGMFEGNMPGRLTEIRKAAAEGNFEKLSNAAHALKSSTCYLGTQRLGSLCDAIRLMAKDGNRDEIFAITNEMEREFHRVRRSFRRRESAISTE